ncbi:MAG: hypothetical protein ABSD38_17345 [Syntrophorhabdales bacterium]|jgi:hypothetical protein
MIRRSLGRAPVRSFVVRIYRSSPGNPDCLLGEVEEVGKKGLRSFKNLNELWTIVNGRSKKSGVGRKEEMPGEHPPGGRQKRGHET